jgi:hypothetical protein
MVLETLIGSLGGGILRMVPEILNWMDRNNARKHELKMQDAAYKFEHLRGAQRMNELGAQNQIALDTGGLAALVTGIKAQGEKTGIGWVDAINSTVRPFLTYWWCVVLMTVAKISQFIILKGQGMNNVESIGMLWGTNEITMVAGIMNFWFLDRVIRKNKEL